MRLLRPRCRGRYPQRDVKLRKMKLSNVAGSLCCFGCRSSDDGFVPVCRRHNCCMEMLAFSRRLRSGLTPVPKLCMCWLCPGHSHFRPRHFTILIMFPPHAAPFESFFHVRFLFSSLPARRGRTVSRRGKASGLFSAHKKHAIVLCRYSQMSIYDVNEAFTA